MNDNMIADKYSQQGITLDPSVNAATKSELMPYHTKVIEIGCLPT
jgi:hypothetical protein